MFTDAEKEEIRAMRAEPFLSFKELITAYKTPEITYVSTGSGYNFAFTDQPESVVDYTPQSGSFYATVHHVALLPDQKIQPGPGNSPILIANPYVRICVTGEQDRDFFDKALKISLDGNEFKPTTYHRPRGIFERPYFEYYFERTL